MSGFVPFETLDENKISANQSRNLHQPIPREAALDMLFQHIQPIGTETVSTESALGRVLSEDVYAPVNLPPFNRSPLDGYAVRANDIAGAAPDNPVVLEINREITLENVGQSKLGKNQAAAIMTGSPFPSGADVVIKLEDVKKTDNKKIRIFSSLPAFSNYCFAGEDIQKGELVLDKGSVIDPTSVGILAGLGLSTVAVYRVPKVVIAGNGSELVNVHGQLKPGQVFDSNSYSIAAYVQKLGASPIYAGTTGDSTEMISRKISEKIKTADMVIMTGGVSVGSRDLVKEALLLLGAKILFHRIAMRPGSPALGAVKDGKLIICLSGNQSAAFVTFHLLALPVLAKLMGIEAQQLIGTTAVLYNDYPKASKLRNFLRGRAFFDNGTLKVKISGKQNPGMIHSTLYCNALIDVPAKTPYLEAGEQVDILLLHMPGLHPDWLPG